MPSEEFYLVLGFIGFFAIIMGAIMMNAGYGHPKPYEVLAGQISVVIGIGMVCILIGGAYFDARPRFRKWNLDRKSTDMALERREREFEKKKHEFEKKYPEESQTQSESQPQATTYPNQTTATTSQKSGTLPKQITTPVEIKQEKQLETGGAVPENLKQNAEVSGKDGLEVLKSDPSLQSLDESKRNDIVLPQRELDFIEKELSATAQKGDAIGNVTENIEKLTPKEEYGIKITNDKYLKYLWTLYRTVGHSFPYENRLIKAAQGNTHNRSRAYQAFETLEKYGLIKYIPKKKFDGKIDRTSKGVELTPIGLALMEKAEKENVTTWNEFLEKYKLEPKK